MAQRDDEDDEGGEVAASDLVLTAFGRDEDAREAFLDRLEDALDSMGASYERDDVAGSITTPLDGDALSMLDDIAGWTGDPEPGSLVHAGVIDDDGDFIPISQAWETWEELLDDVEENIEEYLNQYGEGE